ncbi:MAG: HD domain-containing protein [Rhizobiales bacterium]|nr:HD domain-containing protein [Hyphomicrobiales bacterium]
METRQSPITQVRLAELLGALSHALDMTEGQPAGHCVRCCWIGMQIGREIGLDDTQAWELYYTILLKDAGCSSNAARVCRLYLADDLTLKHDFKRIDGSLPQALRFVLTHTGLKSGLAERFRAIINIVQKGGKLATELIETRCQRGAEIARKMRFSEAVAQGIKNLDEHWDGSGMPEGLTGSDIPLYSRIALIAQIADVFHKAAGEEAARLEVMHRAGTWFDPALAAIFDRVAARPSFWEALNGDDLQDVIYALEPARHTALVDDDYLDDIASAFAQVVDSKSPYTSGHSERVTLYTDMIAEELGLAAERRRWLKRAALLHDIGKLGVSNMILDKPGKLDAAEWVAMKQHAAHTETILSRISAFRELAPVAAAHHERLDGTGYPKGLRGSEIVLESRILTVADIFDALTADRPYRAAMPISKALSIMAGEVGTAIDASCFEALKRALGRIGATLAA